MKSQPGALLKRTSVLHHLFRSFPPKNGNPPHFLKLEGALKKVLGVSRVVFALRKGDAFFHRDKRVSIEGSEVFLRGGGGAGKPRFFGKATPSGWMALWPVLVEGECAALIALGWKKNRKGLDPGEEKGMDLLVDRTALFLEVNGLWEKIADSQRQTALGFLAAAMAHEVRNPLTAMGTLVQLLPLKKGDKGFLENFQQMMTREIDRLTAITGNHLDFIRPAGASAGKVDLDEVVKSVTQLLMPLCRMKQIRLLVKTTPGLFLRGSISQLEILVMNLLQNSIQAAGPGGWIRISAARKAKPGSRILLEVEDNGPGITEEKKHRIFSPFFSTKEGGLGLGLALCQKIIENHQGRVEMKSKPGRGFQLNVSLPELKKG